MRKKLIIVETINDLSKFNKFISNDVDFLVFTPEVMLVLDGKNISYKVIEDFYDSATYLNDFKRFRKKIITLFSKLDASCNSLIEFPYAYSGNELYFMTWFADLIYIEKIIQIINLRYHSVSFFSPKAPESFPNKHYLITDLYSSFLNGTVSLPLERGFQRKMQVIFDAIDIEFLQDAPSKIQKVVLSKKILKFTNRLKGFLKRRLNYLKKPLKITQLKKQSVYVIQDGHEVLSLKKYLYGFKFKYPNMKSRVRMLKSIPKIVSSKQTDKILGEFLEENFQYTNKYISLLMRSYHKEVVGRIKEFKDRFEFQITRDKPNFLFFSYGTRDVFDTVIALIANNNNFPVFFFQHGGHAEFYFEPFQESLEHSSRVEKFLFTQSSNEFKDLNDPRTITIPLGSISQFDSYKLNSFKTPSKDILYCLGPELNFSFRELLNYYSTKQQYENINNTLSVSHKLSIKTDIKLHPLGEDKNLCFFTNLIKKNHFNNVGLIYGELGEAVVFKYKLIIIDYLSSMLVHSILGLPIPVIIFNNQFNSIDIAEDVKKDLRNRCYIVDSIEELESILIKFKDSRLPSKWSIDFMEKYLFSDRNLNPGKAISEYIHTNI